MALYDKDINMPIIVDNLPISIWREGRSQKKKFDYVTFRERLGHWKHAYGFDAIVIEKVHATPQMGVSSAFNFGYTAGSINAVAEDTGVLVIWISPSEWKPKMRCTANKADSQARIKEIIPVAWEGHKKRMRADCAEAILLAYYFANRTPLAEIPELQ